MRFHDYLHRQMAEDRRAFIVHYPAATGKTAFAKRISETRSDTYLFDFQQYWLEHPELSPEELNFEAFKALLLSLSVPEPVVLVDNLDILFNIWRDKDKNAFLNWLKIGLRSPLYTDKTFVFILQTDLAFANADINNSQSESRVLTLDTFDAL